MPRHPPCALISLTYSRIMSCFSTEELFEIVFYPLNFFNWISLISSLLFRYSIFKEHLSLSDIWSPWVLFGGDEENRTPDPLLARQVLSQLSYTPKLGLKVVLSDSFLLSVFARLFLRFLSKTNPSWATPPKVIVIHLWSRQPWGQVPSKLNNTDLRTCEQVLLTSDVRIALFLP